jgi:hypothetical protein
MLLEILSVFPQHRLDTLLFVVCRDEQQQTGFRHGNLITK